MTAGITAVLAKTTINSSGLSKIFENSKTRLNFFNFIPDPTERHTFWTLIIGAIPQFLYLRNSAHLFYTNDQNSEPTVLYSHAHLLPIMDICHVSRCDN